MRVRYCGGWRVKIRELGETGTERWREGGEEREKE